MDNLHSDKIHMYRSLLSNPAWIMLMRDLKVEYDRKIASLRRARGEDAVKLQGELDAFDFFNDFPASKIRMLQAVDMRKLDEEEYNKEMANE